MTKKKNKPADSKDNGAETDVTWQATKSARMRTQILDAAIRCFVKLGYSRTTTTEIAREAGVSRGAMVHHFSNKQQLIKAAVEHLNMKRINDFKETILASDPAADHTDQGIDLYWQHLTSPYFVAFHELSVAARTDPELEKILIPSVKEFEKEWFQTARQLFPEWEGTGELFLLAMDITQFLLEGMSINTMFIRNPKRYERIRNYLKIRLREILAMGKARSGNTAVDSFLDDSSA
ncbi:TetR/AcrR family transcriptional regulator [Emcibacter sp.]|uniref:TetR/AcrR family transcriptional regulator n=1 Tax=Emcibacter sp. TaxID=1979954 RepID=UPI002AA6ABF6|nr:TetR/AcrR family transcriptional regulator [Emcibacter sp.]